MSWSSRLDAFPVWAASLSSLLEIGYTRKGDAIHEDATCLALSQHCFALPT